MPAERDGQEFGLCKSKHTAKWKIFAKVLYGLYQSGVRFIGQLSI